GSHSSGTALGGYLKNELQLDRHAERKAGYTVHQSAGAFVFCDSVLQQLRSATSLPWLLANISRSGHRDPKPDDPRHFVERSQMLPRDSEGIERRQPSRLPACFQIEFRTDASNEFRLVAFCGKHAGQKKKIAGPHRFRIGAERLRRRGKFDAKFFQPLLGADRPRASPSYHLPACAPPSTCNISPVVNVASVKNKTASTTSSTPPILP